MLLAKSYQDPGNVIRQDKDFIHTTHRKKDIKKDNSNYVKYKPPKR